MSGPLSIGIIPTIAPYILPTLIELVRDKYPDLELHIIEDQTKHLVQMLRDGGIDCAILAVPTNTAGLQEIPLYEERFRMVVPAHHPFAGRKDLKLKDLKEVSLLLLDDGHCLRDQIVDLCRKAEFNPMPPNHAETRAASLTTVLQLVSADMGATLIPESAVQTECVRPAVETARFHDAASAYRKVGIVFRGSSTRYDDFSLLGDLVTRSFNQVISQLPR